MGSPMTRNLIFGKFVSEFWMKVDIRLLGMSNVLIRSLGCVIYELAALRPPFDSTTVINLAAKINAGKFSRIPMKYSDNLQEIIRMMIQTDPRRRPRIQELADHPILLPYINKAKNMISEYQNQAVLSSRMRELAAREASIKAREDAVVIREQQLDERESALKLREQQLQAEMEQKAIEKATLPSDPPQKIPIIPITQVRGVAKQMTAGGFSILCDGEHVPPSINLTHHQRPAMGGLGGVKRVQDIITARPLQAVDKENMLKKQPALQVLERRGLRERGQQQISNENNMDLVDDEEIDTPKKKPRRWMEEAAKPRFTDIMNIDPVDGGAMDGVQQPQHRHRMPPPPPILHGRGGI
jgi:hypothetical protein